MRATRTQLSGLVLDRDLLAMIPSRSALSGLGCGQGVCRPTFVSEAFQNAFGVDINEQVSHAHALGRDYVNQSDVADA